MKLAFKFITKVIAGIFKILIMPFKFVFRKFQLWDMDMQWSLHGGNCFSLFPPSFYYTHTPEEADRITEEKLAELTQMVEELKEWEKENKEKKEKKEAKKREKLEKRERWQQKHFRILFRCIPLNRM